MKSLKITNRGKITVAAGIFGMTIVAGIAMLGGYSARTLASGGNGSATTAVKVLNTPPIFDDGVLISNVGYPYEAITSTTTSPWLNGKAYSWGANAHDTSGDHIYLLVCSSSTTPPVAASSTPPVCGTAQIAVSSPFYNGANSTGTVQVYATATIATSSETLPWVAYVCDDANNAKCSPASPGQTGQGNASPAYVTHPFVFTGLTPSVTPPKDPGQAFTVTSSASQPVPDTNNGAVTAKLYVCQAAGFDTTTRTCTSGFYSSSTAAVTANPTANYAFPIPTVAKTYNGVTYVIDQYGYEATGAMEGSTTVFTVNNIAPTVYNVSIASSTINVTNPGGLSTSSQYAINFSSDDYNGCVNASGNQEMSTTTFQFYRTGVASCSAAADHNDHSCYNTASTTSIWAASTTCVQNNCSNFTSQWTCSFPLWYMTDPTTGSGLPWSGDKWRAKVSIMDSVGSTSAATTSLSDSDINQFTYVDLSRSGLDFGAFQPGQGSVTLGADSSSTLGFINKGNNSVDTGVRVSEMCPTYSSSTPCGGSETTDTILANRHQYTMGTGVAYGSGTSGSSTIDAPLALHVPKNTVIGNFTTKSTYWGIFVPGTLTVSGDYKGLDTFIITTNSNSGTW